MADNPNRTSPDEVERLDMAEGHQDRTAEEQQAQIRVSRNVRAVCRGPPTSSAQSPNGSCSPCGSADSLRHDAGNAYLEGLAALAALVDTGGDSNEDSGYVASGSNDGSSSSGLRNSDSAGAASSCGLRNSDNTGAECDGSATSLRPGASGADMEVTPDSGHGDLDASAEDKHVGVEGTSASGSGSADKAFTAVDRSDPSSSTDVLCPTHDTARGQEGEKRDEQIAARLQETREHRSRDLREIMPFAQFEYLVSKKLEGVQLQEIRRKQSRGLREVRLLSKLAEFKERLEELNRELQELSSSSRPSTPDANEVARLSPARTPDADRARGVREKRLPGRSSAGARSRGSRGAGVQHPSRDNTGEQGGCDEVSRARWGAAQLQEIRKERDQDHFEIKLLTRLEIHARAVDVNRRLAEVNQALREVASLSRPNTPDADEVKERSGGADQELCEAASSSWSRMPDAEEVRQVKERWFQGADEVGGLSRPRRSDADEVRRAEEGAAEARVEQERHEAASSSRSNVPDAEGADEVGCTVRYDTTDQTMPDTDALQMTGDASQASFNMQ